jgi:hypothetical protein
VPIPKSILRIGPAYWKTASLIAAIAISCLLRAALGERQNRQNVSMFDRLWQNLVDDLTVVTRRKMLLVTRRKWAENSVDYPMQIGQASSGNVNSSWHRK